VDVLAYALAKKYAEGGGNTTWAKVDKSVSSIADITTRNASDLTQDTNNRLVADSEKSNWNAKETTTGSQTKATTAENNAKSYADGLSNSVNTTIGNHTARADNPHSVTKAQVGLGNVTNESKETMFNNSTLTGMTNINGAMNVNGGTIFSTNAGVIFDGLVTVNNLTSFTNITSFQERTEFNDTAIFSGGLAVNNGKQLAVSTSSSVYIDNTSSLTTDGTTNLQGATNVIGTATFSNSANFQGDITQSALHTAKFGFGNNAGTLYLGNNGGQNTGGGYMLYIPSPGMPNQLNITGPSAGNLDIFRVNALNSQFGAITAGNISASGNLSATGTISSSQGKLGNASGRWTPSAGTFNVPIGTVINIANVPTSNIHYKVQSLIAFNSLSFAIDGFMTSASPSNINNWTLLKRDAYAGLGTSTQMSDTNVFGVMPTLDDGSRQATGYFQINNGQLQFVVVSTDFGAVQNDYVWMTN